MTVAILKMHNDQAILGHFQQDWWDIIKWTNMACWLCRQVSQSKWQKPGIAGAIQWAPVASASNAEALSSPKESRCQESYWVTFSSEKRETDQINLETSGETGWWRRRKRWLQSWACKNHKQAGQGWSGEEQPTVPSRKQNLARPSELY